MAQEFVMCIFMRHVGDFGKSLILLKNEGNDLVGIHDDMLNQILRLGNGFKQALIYAYWVCIILPGISHSF